MIASILTLTRKDIQELRRRNKTVDAYTIHKVIYSLFPGAVRNFLYCDQGGNIHARNILIISETMPQTPESETIEIKSKEIPESFLNYTLYAFQVKLNPVTSQSRKKNRRAVIGQAELRKWFLAETKKWGFEVSGANLEISGTGVENIEKTERTITYNTAVFKGVLRVTDPDRFRASFRGGLGRGRAFGYGLLQIRPLFE